MAVDGRLGEKGACPVDTDFIIRYVRSREYVLIDEATAQRVKDAYEAALPRMRPGVIVSSGSFEGQDLVMGGTRHVSFDWDRLQADFIRAQTEGWQAIEIPETPERLKALRDALYAVRYMRDQHHLLIGEKTAGRMLSDLLGSESPEHEMTYAVRGRNLLDGLPTMVEITAAEIRDALARYYDQEKKGNQESA